MVTDSITEAIGQICMIFFAIICIGIFLIGGVWGFVLLQWLTDYPFLWVILIGAKVLIGFISYFSMRPISNNRISWLFIGYFFPLLSLALVWYFRKKEGV